MFPQAYSYPVHCFAQFFMCLADKSVEGYTTPPGPAAKDYTYYDHVQLNLIHRPPSPPPSPPPPSPPPSTPPDIQMSVPANSGPINANTGAAVAVEHGTNYSVEFTGSTLAAGDVVIAVSAASLKPYSHLATHFSPPVATRRFARTLPSPTRAPSAPPRSRRASPPAPPITAAKSTLERAAHPRWTCTSRAWSTRWTRSRPTTRRIRERCVLAFLIPLYCVLYRLTFAF